MKILSAVICFSVLCLTFYAFAADDAVNFSGTWVLDSKESDPFPRPVMSLGAEPGRRCAWSPGGMPADRAVVAGLVARVVVADLAARVVVAEDPEASPVNPANRLPWS